MMKIVALSDTHTTHDQVNVPDGDILVFAGDMCTDGKIEEVVKFRNWLDTLPHKHKVIIPGNHDWPFYDGVGKHLFEDVATYLQDSSVEIEGIKIYGSPWQPVFHHWAFNLPRGKELQEKWNMIPEDTDILVTHCPQSEILDLSDGAPVGCVDLKNAISRVKPKLHIFGHIHNQYGIREINGVKHINASLTDYLKRLVNDPILIDY